MAATLENVWLAFDPRVVMAAMHTTMIRASMTAYSTAVGPSSFRRKSTSVRVIVRLLVVEDRIYGEMKRTGRPLAAPSCEVSYHRPERPSERRWRTCCWRSSRGS